MPTDMDADDFGSFASPPCFLHELDPDFRGLPAADAPNLDGAVAPARRRAARLLPARPFPPYAYLPGRFPHPIRDPLGHSHISAGSGSAAEPAADPEAMLWGTDLFNHGFYWEAHEAWEGVWRVTPKGTPDRDVLHGLILLAAAGVKLREGKLDAACRHGLRAARLFRGAASAGLGQRVAALGLTLGTLAAQAEHAVSPPADRAGETLVFEFDLGASPRESA